MKKKNQLSAPQIIVFAYLVTAVLFSFILYFPISLKENVRISFLDALFTSVSALSVTGLTAVDTGNTFSTFGVFVIMFLIQLGGIGIMTLGTLFWLILGQNISLSQRKLIMIDQNRQNLSGMVRLMKLVFAMALLFEFIATIVLMIYFKGITYADSWLEALYYGAFHAVSSFTNAGFDIFGDSLISFRHDYFIQIVTMILIILGAIGFPVLIEIREKLFNKRKQFRFSLFAKLSVTTFFALLLFGFISIWLLESRFSFSHFSWHEQLFQALFNSVTSRSAGLTTMDVNLLSAPSQFLMSILMFIGASPSSVGGGIRTTTFVVIVLTLITYARGRREVRAFNRTIQQEDMMKSFIVFSTAMVLTSCSVILLFSFEPAQSLSLNAVIFEISSAFGTTGLSTGITEQLSGPSKVLLIALMFIGRIGLLSLFFLFQRRGRKPKIQYPKETIIIG